MFWLTKCKKILYFQLCDLLSNYPILASVLNRKVSNLVVSKIKYNFHRRLLIYFLSFLLLWFFNIIFTDVCSIYCLSFRLLWLFNIFLTDVCSINCLSFLLLWFFNIIFTDVVPFLSQFPVI